MPWRFAAATASTTTSGVVSESAAKIPPVWNQRAPSVAEEVLPVDVARPQLRGGRVAAIGHADGAAHAEAALGEVEPVAHRPSDAVGRNPADEARVDPSLEHEVLEQPADLVVGERGHDAGAEAEAAPEPPRDVVLATALPRLEPAGGANPPLARIEAQHDLAERDEVVAALVRGADREPAGHSATSAASVAASRASRVTAA